METHCYRHGKRDLSIDIYKPENQVQSLPAIVFFFGGGWKTGNKDQFRPFAEHLCQRGMVAAVADYRIELIDGVPPCECVSDGKSVIRYLRAHAAELGIDPERLAAGGGSAGGHVAAATACVDKWDHVDDDLSISPRPQALALFNPVINNGPDNYGYERVAAYYKDFSPFHRVHDQWPPTLVMLGTEDNLIPVPMMQEFSRMIRDQGSRCEVHYYEGEGHGFFNHGRGDGTCFGKTRQVLDDFLVSLDYLPPV